MGPEEGEEGVAQGWHGTEEAEELGNGIGVVDEGVEDEGNRDSEEAQDSQEDLRP